MSALFPSLAAPVAPAGIDLRCGDVREMLGTVASAKVFFSDPPWEYAQRVGGAGPAVEDHYDCLPTEEIIAHLAMARTRAAVGGRCVLWTTHSQLPGLTRFVEQRDDGAYLGGWRWVTGGMWAKVTDEEAPGGRGAPGIGYHCLSSESEPWILLLADGPHERAPVPGCWIQPRHRGRGEVHSEKPVDYQRAMIRGWTKPDDLVVDLYAGMASVARACLAEGRRYVGAEIDPERYARALVKLREYGSLL